MCSSWCHHPSKIPTGSRAEVKGRGTYCKFRCWTWELFQTSSCGTAVPLVCNPGDSLTGSYSSTRSVSDWELSLPKQRENKCQKPWISTTDRAPAHLLQLKHMKPKGTGHSLLPSTQSRALLCQVFQHLSQQGTGVIQPGEQQLWGDLTVTFLYLKGPQEGTWNDKDKEECLPSARGQG